MDYNKYIDHEVPQEIIDEYVQMILNNIGLDRCEAYLHLDGDYGVRPKGSFGPDETGMAHTIDLTYELYEISSREYTSAHGFNPPNEESFVAWQKYILSRDIQNAIDHTKNELHVYMRHEDVLYEEISPLPEWCRRPLPASPKTPIHPMDDLTGAPNIEI